MSELRKEALDLLTKTGLLENTSNELICAEESLSNELKYSKNYGELLKQLDKLMNYENSDETKYEELISELEVPFIDKSNTQELKDYLLQVQDIRRLLIMDSMTVIPILRAIHHVEGIPSKEINLRHKISKRDDISLEIIQLQEIVKKKQSQLTNLKLKNKELMTLSRKLIKKIPTKPQQDSDRIIELKKTLKEAKEKSYGLSEEIQLLLVRNGVNWLDPELLEIVKYCGEVYQ